jgi:hypothetical protein
MFGGNTSMIDNQGDEYHERADSNDQPKGLRLGEAPESDDSTNAGKHEKHQTEIAQTLRRFGERGCSFRENVATALVEMPNIGKAPSSSGQRDTAFL